MTDAELRALCEATPTGPWTVEVMNEGVVTRREVVGVGFRHKDGGWHTPVLCDAHGPEAAAFIAAARTALPALLDDKARLIEENAALRELLGDLAPFFGMSSIARYDALAEKFYQATGIMGPGKSVPVEMENGQPPHEERASRMREWLKAETEALSARIDAALALGEGG